MLYQHARLCLLKPLHGKQPVGIDCQILLASRTTLSCQIRAPGIARTKGLLKPRLSLVCGKHIHISEVAIMTQHDPTISCISILQILLEAIAIFLESFISFILIPCVPSGAAKVSALCKWWRIAFTTSAPTPWDSPKCNGLRSRLFHFAWSRA
jgi:hypothetical protein